MKYLIIALFIVSFKCDATSVAGSAPHVFRATPTSHKISFQPTWNRYLPPDVFLKTLKMRFPYSRLTDDGCQFLNSSNRKLLGNSDPLTGKPSLQNPNSSTINWYNICLSKYVVNNQKNFLSQSNIKKMIESDGRITYQTTYQPPTEAQIRSYFGDEVIVELLNRKGDLFDNVRTATWSSLNLFTQQSHLRYLVNMLIGPEDILIDLDLARTEEEFIKILSSQISELMSLPADKLTFLEVNSPENPSLLEITKAAQFLILFNDIMKE